MNPVPELAPNLKQLRLSGILDSLEVRNRQAIESKLAYTEFLSLLIHDEVARRDQKKFELRLRRAAFRAGKSLEGFDFTRLPNLSRPLIHDLATGRYLLEKAPVLIVGPCGTGKSHLAHALGHQAVLQDRRVLCRGALDLAVEMGDALDAGERKNVVARFLRPDLLIIDDFGLSPLPAAAAQYFLEILLRRYETASTIFTSNRTLADFGAVLGDPTAAMAILDRFLHHAHVIKITGPSYRLQHPGVPASDATADSDERAAAV